MSVAVGDGDLSVMALVSEVVQHPLALGCPCLRFFRRFGVLSRGRRPLASEVRVRVRVRGHSIGSDFFYFIFFFCCHFFFHSDVAGMKNLTPDRSAADTFLYIRSPRPASLPFSMTNIVYLTNNCWCEELFPLTQAENVCGSRSLVVGCSLREFGFWGRGALPQPIRFTPKTVQSKSLL